MPAETDRRAVALFPELHRLIHLRDGFCWSFLVAHDDNGDVYMVAGGRGWPTGWSDGIAIRGLGDVRAYRLDPTHCEVWMREGGLTDVIDELVELPNPGQPGAPRLVRGASAAPRLWLPPSARGAVR